MPPRTTLQKTVPPNFSPSNLAEAMAFADILAKSSMVPKDYIGNPGNILVAMAMGAEVGLKPLQALLGIAFIDGRPGIHGDAFWALILAHPEFEDSATEDNATSCTITLTRRNKGAVVRSYTLDDAKRAGLLQSIWWQANPKRMLMIRARTFAGRDLFADALCGMTTVEELRDNATPVQPTIKATVKPAKTAPPAALAPPSPASYSAKEFADKAIEWKVLVTGGIKTAEDLIALLSTKKTLLEAQCRVIRSWAEQPEGVAA